ncbi:MAG: tetratricopeptide repeat protein [Putridiphycobacter sp.]
MKKIVLVLFLLPILAFSQTDYSLKAKRVYKEAHKFLSTGNKVEAEKLFKECLTLEPNYVEALYNLSVLAYNDKDYASSINYAGSALAISKTKAPIYTQMAKSYFMVENYDSSAYYANIATILDSQSDESFYVLAKSENNIRKFEKALGHIESAIKINGNNAAYYNVRGVANFGQGNNDAALSDFNKVLELDPNFNGVYKNLANVYIAEGNSEKAIENIDKGISSATGDEKVAYLVLKGNYYHSIGDLENAKKAFQEAMELDSESPVVLTNMAAVEIDSDNFESAVENCTKAIELDPTMTEAYFNRGIANEMLRKTEEACSDWEEAFILGAVKAEDYLNSPTCNE